MLILKRNFLGTYPPTLSLSKGKWSVGKRGGHRGVRVVNIINGVAP